VAVAYKLVEALYQTQPHVPQQPLEDLSDLVAIGLIADLVQLSGLSFGLGIERLQQNLQQPPGQRRRPGVGRLLELCQKWRSPHGYFFPWPRINAVSRIQGDASFVELLTSQVAAQLAQDSELANARRKSLQKMFQQVVQKLKELDLSTTVVLEDAQGCRCVGISGWASAQENGRPNSVEYRGSRGAARGDENFTPLLARGSARSVNQVDL